MVSMASRHKFYCCAVRLEASALEVGSVPTKKFSEFGFDSGFDAAHSCAAHLLAFVKGQVFQAALSRTGTQ
jgi:hypothetical protein